MLQVCHWDVAGVTVTVTFTVTFTVTVTITVAVTLCCRGVAEGRGGFLLEQDSSNKGQTGLQGYSVSTLSA
jgi:hypothetical protein